MQKNEVKWREPSTTRFRYALSSIRKKQTAQAVNMEGTPEWHKSGQFAILLECGKWGETVEWTRMPLGRVLQFLLQQTVEGKKWREVAAAQKSVCYTLWLTSRALGLLQANISYWNICNILENSSSKPPIIHMYLKQRDKVVLFFWGWDSIPVCTTCQVEEETSPSLQSSGGWGEILYSIELKKNDAFCKECAFYVVMFSFFIGTVFWMLVALSLDCTAGATPLFCSILA